QRLKKEATVWLHLHHRNIAEFYGACLVSLWYNNGTASKYVVAKNTPTKLAIIKDIALGIQYLHSQNIVHRDIKGKNALITDDGTAVVTDFGLSTILEHTTGYTATSLAYAGAPRWFAPELFKNQAAPKPDLLKPISGL
ncbi:kinase-like domain-containing protein, partial [Mycena floridula]